MERKDILLMVVASGGSVPLTPVQLQKSLFLIGENMKEAQESFYEFEPYHYGPFDIEIYADAKSLEAEGLLYSTRSSLGTWVDRGITAEGFERVKEIRESLSPSSQKYVDAVVKWTQSVSFTSLVKAIYDHYPEYRANSVFQG